jgi:hypothetical protein
MIIINIKANNSLIKESSLIIFNKNFIRESRAASPNLNRLITRSKIRNILIIPNYRVKV